MRDNARSARIAVILATLVVAAALAGCAQTPRTTATPTGANATPTTASPTNVLPTTTPPTPPPGGPPPATTPDVLGEWRSETPLVRLVTTAGNITVEADLERAPITAGNFLDLVRSGFYDGVKFHRVSPNFVIQGGDPNSKDDDPANDGQGGPGYEIPDEFHPALRHDAKGMLSMATAGPDTGGSQFFITLAAEPRLDDRHSVFGRVVDGMATVDAIATAPVTRETPRDPVTITNASVIGSAIYAGAHGLALTPVFDEKPAEPGRPVTFAVIVKNEGNTRDAPTLAVEAPSGWTTAPISAPTIPAGTARIVFVSITPPSDATGTVGLTLRAKSAWNGTEEATTPLKVRMTAFGAAIAQGDTIRANYVGMLLDGRVFDTSVAGVAKDAEIPKMATMFQERPSYSPFSFTVGSGVIEGFTQLAKTAKVGEIVTMRIDKRDAYAGANMYSMPLADRDLVFELQILEKG